MRKQKVALIKILKRKMAGLDKLNIVQWNARSISSNKYSFVQFLVQYNIDIALVVETWLKPGIDFSIQGYSCIRKDRIDGHGGVLILINEDIVYESCDYQFNYNIEIIGIKIKHSNIYYNLINIYRPPNIKIKKMNGLR